jgi:RNA polymerase sigma-70 factor (ECF subfamily)
MRRSPDRGGDGDVRAGDGLDMRALVVTHLAMMKAWARRLCRGAIEADDVLQDAVLRALETEHPPRDPTRVGAWLHRVVHNTFIDAVRRQRRRREYHLDTDLPDRSGEESTCAPWEEISQGEVRAAVAHLADHLRVTYQMFELEGRSFADIAAALAIRNATVGTRVLRARKQLRVLLAPSAQAPVV